MNPTFSRHIFLFSYLLVFVGVALLLWYFHAVPQEDAKRMLQEDGLVEQMSAVGYVVCLLAMLWFGGVKFVRAHFPLVAFPLVFALRELDFDKRFTETGLLQGRIFTSPDVALFERLAGIVVMLTLVGLLIFAARRYLLPLLRNLLRFDPVALGVGIAMGLMVVSKAIDGLGRKLEPLGIVIAAQTEFEAGMLEEVLELGIPVVLFIAILAYFRRHEPAKGGSHI